MADIKAQRLDRISSAKGFQRPASKQFSETHKSPVIAITVNFFNRTQEEKIN
jgi:hypothetical protein